MSKATEARQDWWITTDFLERGGEKVKGPFGSRGLAMEHRTFLEERERHNAYFVDSEPIPTEVPA